MISVVEKVAEVATLDDIPEGWAIVPFLDVIDYEGGSQPPKKEFVYEPKRGYVRLIQIRDFGDKPFPTYVPDSTRLKKANADDLLLARYGGGAGDDCLGRICTGLAGAYNVALVKLKFPRHFIDAGFVKCFFLGTWFKEAISVNSRSCQQGFNRDDLKLLTFSLAPLAEQKRIVAKVEVLLARVNAARERLAKAPVILKRFRQAVLAAACSGRLTEDWRINQKLVSSVHASRQQLLEAGSEWYETNFEKRPEYELPDLWEYVALGNLGTWGGGGTPSTSKPEYWEKGTIPWVSPKDMKSELISRSQDHITRRALSETNLKLISEGSLLFVVRGMILAHTFPVGLSTLPVTVNQDIRTLTPYKGVSREFLLRAMRYEATSILHAVRESTHGTRRLESETLKSWPIPVPPIEEQHEIVRRVEALFKLADTIEKHVATATMRADKLTQAILAKAFCSKLVPTEAELSRREERDYETATQLLDRITVDRQRKFSPTRKVTHKKRVLRQHWKKQ